MSKVKFSNSVTRAFRLGKDVAWYYWGYLELPALIGSLKQRPRWRLSEPWKDAASISHKEIGDIGEDLATQFLRQNRYKVLCRNYTPKGGGEIDVVCRKGDTLVFIEVKTRIAPTDRRPLLNITSKKRDQLKKGATQYLRLLQREKDSKNPATNKQIKIPLRFDVVEVLLYEGIRPELNIIEGLYMDKAQVWDGVYRKNLL